MVKKAIFILVFTLFLITNIENTFALDFSWEKWFYSSIADDIWNIEKKFYSIELAWETGTKEKINSISKLKCLVDNLSEDEILKIMDGELEDIIDSSKWRLEKTCIGEDWSISLETLNDLLTAISTIHNEALWKAKEKTAQVINIDSTWIYTDWVEGNAPFDLIIDIKNIDKIIFAQKTSHYDWVNNFNLDKEMSKMLGVALEINANSTDNVVNDEGDINLNNINNRYNDLKSYNSSNSDYIYSSYVCSADSTANSWLSKDSILNLANWWEGSNNYTPAYDDDYNYFNGNPEWQFGENYLVSPNGSYTRVNDDSVFPCTSFFCINVDFVTYNHQLLNSWKDMSIEDILSRSNEHLKKFAGTSLIQSKMTINNFELWLKDLNLPDIFHIWVEVVSKPVPILDLTYGKDEETKDDEKGIFALKEQMEFYYKAYWLDYSRKNDLSLLEKIEIDRQVLSNANWLDIEATKEKFEEQDEEYNQKKLEQVNLMKKLIENETKISILWDLEKQFKELEVFNKAVKDYVENLKALIWNLLKIPVDTGAI